VPEVRRLLLVRDEDPATRAFLLGWSRFRRAHQAVAQRCHVARRLREHATRAHLAAIPPGAAAAVPPAGLTDAEWARVRPLLPPQQPAVGRRCHDHRTILGGILWVLRAAAPWREMPARFGKWNTAYVRYRLWQEQGLWQRIIDALGPDALPPPRAGPP
jgi:Putative transposase of IS4/5 family (DUF4096)